MQGYEDSFGFGRDFVELQLPCLLTPAAFLPGAPMWRCLHQTAAGVRMLTEVSFPVGLGRSLMPLHWRSVNVLSGSTCQEKSTCTVHCHGH